MKYTARLLDRYSFKGIASDWRSCRSVNDFMIPNRNVLIVDKVQIWSLRVAGCRLQIVDLYQTHPEYHEYQIWHFLKLSVAF